MALKLFEYHIWHIDDELDERIDLKKMFSVALIIPLIRQSLTVKAAELPSSELKNQILALIADEESIKNSVKLVFKSFETVEEWQDEIKKVQEGKVRAPFCVYVDIGLPHSDNTLGYDLLMNLYKGAVIKTEHNDNEDGDEDSSQGEDEVKTILRPKNMVCVSGQVSGDMLTNLELSGINVIRKSSQHYTQARNAAVSLIADNIIERSEGITVKVTKDKIFINGNPYEKFIRRNNVNLQAAYAAIKNGYFAVETEFVEDRSQTVIIGKDASGNDIILTPRELDYVGEEAFNKRYSRTRASIDEKVGLDGYAGSRIFWECFRYSGSKDNSGIAVLFFDRDACEKQLGASMIVI